MTTRLTHPTYLADLEALCAQELNWQALEGRRIVVSGATGMIGATLVDCLARKRREDGLDVTVLALGRDRAKAKDRLPYFGEPWFDFREVDLSRPGLELSARDIGECRDDLVFHLASATHPRSYALDPVGVVRGNVNGLEALWGWLAAHKHEAAGSAAQQRCDAVFASSVEIYGENRGDVERFDEGYLGYIDCATTRACYPEAKRVCEALCEAYAAQYGVQSVICRISRAYGPTLLASDSKALSQFIHKALDGEPVVLKSAGTQNYSYLYTFDCVSALIWCATAGRLGEAYNAASIESEITLLELARKLAELGGVELVHEAPDAVEAAGFSKATVALMDPRKIESQGWQSRWDLDEGLAHTLAVLGALDEPVSQRA